MSFTVEELEYYIENDHTDEHGSVNSSEFYDEMKYGKTYSLDGFGEAETVDTHGGEGQGENLWVVFSIGDRLFRKFGYWVSYDGSDWDGELEEVEAFEKTVTDYRRV